MNHHVTLDCGGSAPGSAPRPAGTPALHEAPVARSRRGDRFPSRAGRLPRPGARGVVLVMILGILAVMVIMAVSFAVAMRTERVAAANAVENIRVRMLLDSALTRAIEDMRLDLTNQVYPLWDVRASRSPNDLACSQIGVAFEDFISGAMVARSGTTNYGILYGAAANYIPLAYYGMAVTEDLLPWAYTNQVIEPIGWVTNIVAPRWVPVVEPFSMIPPGTNQWSVETNDVGGVPVVITNVGSRVVGRVGWVTVNCSGLLDANFVGGLARANGTDPREINLDALSEISSEAAFVAQRNTDVRYDTLFDLDQNNQPFPSNLFVYSRALSGSVTNFFATNMGVYQPASLAGDTTALLTPARRVAISNELLRMGFTNAGQASELFLNLLDYVDSDSIPRLPNTAATVEAMPFLNEVVFINQYRRELVIGPPNFQRYTISNSVQVELWYPFPTVPPGGIVSNRIAMSFAPLGGTPAAWFPAAPVVFWTNMVLAANGFYLPGQIAGPNLVVDVPPFPTPPPALIQYRVTINSDTYQSNVLQRLGLPVVVDVVITSAVANSSVTVMRECLDPRMGGQAAMWFNCPASTLGQVNTNARNYWVANPGCDTNLSFFCANTSLLSVVELGCLPLPGAPWRTVSLMGTNRSTILNSFTMSTNSGATNEFHGLVNPNTTQRDALAAAFDGMPIESYPGGAPVGTLSLADAQLLADTIIASWPYTNLADLGAANWDGFFSSCSLAAQFDNPLKKETFLRNLVGLLNLRQNVFTIVLAAELAGADNDRFPRHAIRQRAVAIVWRDPYLNRFFIRSVKYLPD